MPRKQLAGRGFPRQTTVPTAGLRRRDGYGTTGKVAGSGRAVLSGPRSLTSGMALADSASHFAASLTIERNPGATNCLVTITGTWNHAHVTEVAFALGPYPSSTAPPAFTTTAVSGDSGTSSVQVTLASSQNSQSFQGYASFYGRRVATRAGRSCSVVPPRPR